MQVKILGSAAGWRVSAMELCMRQLPRPAGWRVPRQSPLPDPACDQCRWPILVSPRGFSGFARANRKRSGTSPAGWPAPSPIAGAVLANADLDHVLGLLLLRELQPLRVHATPSIRRILCEDNSMFAMLRRTPNQVSWEDFIPGEPFPLLGAAGEDSGLRCRALSLGTHYPDYVAPQSQANLVFGEASLGLLIDAPSGKRLAYMPAVPQLHDALLREFDSADVLLFDGTFWSDRRTDPHSGQRANRARNGPCSHLGDEGSLHQLAQLRRPRKIFLHINNTNPMLDEASPHHRAVRDAGWEIAEDGWQFTL